MEPVSVLGTGDVSGTVQKTKAKLKGEQEMEGIDPNVLLAKLDNNEDNWLKWILTIGLLSGEGFGFGGRRGEGGAALGKIQAQLDCLQQEHQTSALASHNDNVTSQLHLADMARQRDAAAAAKQLAECCCDIRTELSNCCCKLSSEHKDIINAICQQTNTLTIANTANTQSILTSIERHADEEQAAKLNAALTENSNLKQSIEFSAMLKEHCSDGNGGGHRSG